jgi:PIN domain
MNDKPFFDTNVLVYVLGEQGERTVQTEALVASGGVVSVQVLNELAAVARRKLWMTWADIEEALAAIRASCPSPVPLTMATHEAGLRIAAQYQLRPGIVVQRSPEGCVPYKLTRFADHTDWGARRSDGQEAQIRTGYASPFTEHAWKAIPPTRADAPQGPPTQFPSTISRNIDMRRRVSVNQDV